MDFFFAQIVYLDTSYDLQWSQPVPPKRILNKNGIEPSPLSLTDLIGNEPRSKTVTRLKQENKLILTTTLH